jgi:hypothetical protein
LVYDDGVERYGLLDEPLYLLRLAHLDAGYFEVQDEHRLIGTYASGFAVVDITPQGLTSTVIDSIAGGNQDPFWLGAGRAVSMYGEVFDATSMQTVGDIALEADTFAQVALSEDGRTAYFVQSFTPAGGGGIRISCFDLFTLEQRGRLHFDARPPDPSGNAYIYQVARWGRTGMALVVPGGIMLIDDGTPELAGCE